MSSILLVGCSEAEVLETLVIEINDSYLSENDSLEITFVAAEEYTAESTEDSASDGVYEIVLTDTQYELPLQNSMGISYSYAYVKSSASSASSNVEYLEPGDVFLIQEDIDDSWLRIITEDGNEGYFLKMQTLINLPDVIPSIIYDLSNSYSSLFTSSGYDIPNVTGLELYDYKEYNERLGYNEYIAVVLYPMAEKINTVQQTALANNDTLVIYEAYRPYDVQQLVVKELTSLAYSNSTVYNGLYSSPWSLGWFIAESVSNHQKGLAIDTTLASIVDSEVKYMNGVAYNEITDYEEYTMQSDMHELSVASVSMITPVASNTSLAWVDVALADNMTDAAILLREYCWAGGLEPLASEWWHFNDLVTLSSFNNTNTTQSLSFDNCISVAPDA